MENIVVSFQKTEPGEVIEKGELLELSSDNTVTRSSSEMSSMIVGIANESNKDVESIPYFLYGIDMNVKTQQNIETIIAGIATVKTTGLVNIGDLLVSSDVAGRARAVRYAEDNSNIGKIIGKAIQYTENEDEVVAIISIG